MTEPSASPHLSGLFCQPPQEVEQGYVVAVQKAEYEVGFDIHYLCRKNYLLDGPQKITCLSNGSWSASPPHCRGEQQLEWAFQENQRALLESVI